jgi:hypothetical protein
LDRQVQFFYTLFLLLKAGWRIRPARGSLSVCIAILDCFNVREGNAPMASWRDKGLQSPFGTHASDCSGVNSQ